MLKSITILLAFQAHGELLSFAAFPSIPGPVLGLVSLFETNPKSLYVNQANRLKNLGL